MDIKYILSFPTSLIYYIFAQIDFKEEWGPASLFCLPYIELLEKHNKNLLITEKNKNDIKNILKNYFTAITFMCLRLQNNNYDKIIRDFSDNKFLKEQIKEQLAEYVTQQYLKQHHPTLARKKIISYPLLTEQIKRTLGIN